MDKKLFDEIPEEVWRASEVGGYRELLSAFEQAFRSRFAQILQNKVLKFQGISGEGNLNIMVSEGNPYFGRTPLSIHIANPKTGRPVSDITGIVVGIHVGNEQGQNTFAEVLGCEMPNLHGLQSYEVPDRGASWVYFRLRSIQDFELLFNTQNRYVA